MIAAKNPGLAHFVTLDVAQLETQIVLAADARRRQRRLGRRLGDTVLDPDALGSLVRVLQRQGARTVRDLGVPAAAAWARRVGVDY
jgi:hypothetical protein